MAARKTHPARVHTAVTSVTQTWSGAGAEKSRSTMLSAIRLVFLLSVVALKRRFLRAAMPFSCMILATVFSETRSPALRNSRVTRGLP